MSDSTTPANSDGEVAFNIDAKKYSLLRRKIAEQRDKSKQKPPRDGGTILGDACKRRFVSILNSTIFDILECLPIIRGRNLLGDRVDGICEYTTDNVANAMIPFCKFLNETIDHLKTQALTVATADDIITRAFCEMRVIANNEDIADDKRQVTLFISGNPRKLPIRNALHSIVYTLHEKALSAYEEGISDLDLLGEKQDDEHWTVRFLHSLEQNKAKENAR